jgi:hypothetical protein
VPADPADHHRHEGIGENRRRMERAGLDRRVLALEAARADELELRDLGRRANANDVEPGRRPLRGKLARRPHEPGLARALHEPVAIALAEAEAPELERGPRAADRPDRVADIGRRRVRRERDRRPVDERRRVERAPHRAAALRPEAERRQPRRVPGSRGAGGERDRIGWRGQWRQSFAGETTTVSRMKGTRRR